MSSRELLLNLVSHLLIHNSNNQSRDTIPKASVPLHHLPAQTQCACKDTKRKSLVRLRILAHCLPLVLHALA